MFNDTDFEVLLYCASECERQGSGEMSVYSMVNAWDFAQGTSPSGRENTKRMTSAFIEHIGQLVEPQKNSRGFRQIPIYVGNGWEYIEKAKWERVPELLTMLLESYYEGILDEAPMHPLSKSAEDQFYFEYENIHPFVDGNGRSGKILYNYLCGTLDNPKMPPNFWGSSNP